MGELEELIAKTVAIPSVPNVILKIQDVVNNPNSSMVDAVKILEEDPGLGTQCLRIANSAVYGLRTPCATLRHATTVLGLRKLRDLALQSSLVAKYTHLRNTRGFNIDLFWQHAAVSAISARNIAKNTKRFRGSMAETAASCGLLHNIGRLVMIDSFRASYFDVILPVGGFGGPAVDGEMEAFGFTHATVGALLAEKWHLAPEIIDAARNHHQTRAGEPTLSHLIGFANEVAHGLLISKDQAVIDALASKDAAFLGFDTSLAEQVGQLIVNESVNAVISAA